MANFKIRCRLVYHHLKISLFQLFIAAVRNGIYNNASVFTAPPVAEPQYVALLNDYNIKYDNYKNRIGSKGDYLTARSALMDALDLLADYVDEVAQNNADIIILAGYEPTTGVNNNVPAPLQAQNVTITRGTPGTLITDCDPVAYADSYGVILVADNPLPGNIIMNGSGQLEITGGDMEASLAPAGAASAEDAEDIKALIDLNKNRKKTFINLAIGTTYYAYYWSVNAGGVSPLSVVVSKKVVEG